MKTIKNNIEIFNHLASKFTIDPETGVFTNIRTGFSGHKPDINGYTRIGSSIEGKTVILRANRLAWFMYHGEIPPTIVDHINGDKADNRLCNLQLLSSRENIAKGYKDKKGTSSQYTGVSWDKAAKKWRATIMLTSGKHKYLGLFKNEFVAACVYQNALTAHLSEARKIVNL